MFQAFQTPDLGRNMFLQGMYLLKRFLIEIDTVVVGRAGRKISVLVKQCV